MKKLQNIFLLIATLNSMALHSATIDEIREARKDDLISCYEKSQVLQAAINEIREEYHNRPFLQQVLDTVEYAIEHNIDKSPEEIKKDSNKYQNYIPLKKLSDKLELQNQKCAYLKKQIPKKTTTQNPDDHKSQEQEEA